MRNQICYNLGSETLQNDNEHITAGKKAAGLKSIAVEVVTNIALADWLIITPFSRA